MSQKNHRPLTYRANRRQFLQLMGAGVTSAAFLSACAAAGVPAAGTTTTAGSAAAGTHSEWVTGKVASDISAPFAYSSWEGEEEMRKWLLHFDNIFKTNYPNVKVQGDWGVEWG